MRLTNKKPKKPLFPTKMLRKALFLFYSELVSTWLELRSSDPPAHALPIETILASLIIQLSHLSYFIISNFNKHP